MSDDTHFSLKTNPGWISWILRNHPLMGTNDGGDNASQTLA